MCLPNGNKDKNDSHISHAEEKRGKKKTEKHKKQKLLQTLNYGDIITVMTEYNLFFFFSIKSHIGM